MFVRIERARVLRSVSSLLAGREIRTQSCKGLSSNRYAENLIVCKPGVSVLEGFFCGFHEVVDFIVERC
jgi:hypothetical protein